MKETESLTMTSESHKRPGEALEANVTKKPSLDSAVTLTVTSESRKRPVEAIEAVVTKKPSLDSAGTSPAASFAMTPVSCKWDAKGMAIGSKTLTLDDTSPRRRSARLALGKARPRCEYHADDEACGCSIMQDENLEDHHDWGARVAMPACVAAAAVAGTPPLGSGTMKATEMSEKVSPSLPDVTVADTPPLKLGSMKTTEMSEKVSTSFPDFVTSPSKEVDMLKGIPKPEEGVPVLKEAETGATSDGVPQGKEAGADGVPGPEDGVLEQALLHDNSAGNAKVAAGSTHQDTRAGPPSASQLPPSLEQTPPLRCDVAISGSLIPLASQQSSWSPSLEELTETSRQSCPQSTSPMELNDVRSKRAASEESAAPTVKRGRREDEEEASIPEDQGSPSPSRTFEVPYSIVTRSKRRHDDNDNPGGLDLTGIAMTARQRPVRKKLNFSKTQETSKRKTSEELQDTSEKRKKRKTDENTPSMLPASTPSFDDDVDL